MTLNRIFNLNKIAALLIALPVALVIGFVMSRNNTTIIILFFSLIGAAVVGGLIVTQPRKVLYLGLSTSLFLAAFYPFLRISIGSLPIYFTDFCLVAAFAALLLLRRKANLLTSNIVTILGMAYIILTALVLINEFRLTGRILEPIYMLGRNLLSMGAMVLSLYAFDNFSRLRAVLISLVIALLLTATIGNLQAFPNSPTRQIIPLLVPAAKAEEGSRYYNKYLEDEEEASRSQALVGKANVTGAVITLIWPLALGMYASSRFKKLNWLLALALVIGAIGVITTYSRSTYLAFLFALMTMFISNLKPRGRWKVAFVVLLLCTVLAIGIGQVAGLFIFEFIIDKFARIGAGTDAYATNEAVRIYTYTEAVTYLLDRPSSWITGFGLATQDLAARGHLPVEVWTAIPRAKASVLVSTLYQRGFIAMLALISVWTTALWYVSVKLPRLKALQDFKWLLWGLQAVYVSFIPYWATTHIHNDNLMVQMLMFCLFGITGSLAMSEATGILDQDKVQADG